MIESKEGKHTTLLGAYREMITVLPRRAASHPRQFHFTTNTIGSSPRQLYDSKMTVEARQRHASFGLVDNLVLRLDRTRASALGLWCLSKALNAETGRSVVRLQHAKSDVRYLIIRPARTAEYGVQYSINRFIWNPQPINEFFGDLEKIPFFAQRPRIVFSNFLEDVVTPAEYAARDSLFISGNKAGLCLLATFLLDFGLDSATENYEYVNNHLVASGSCELRIELLDLKAIPLH